MMGERVVCFAGAGAGADMGTAHRLAAHPQDLALLAGRHPGRPGCLGELGYAPRTASRPRPRPKSGGAWMVPDIACRTKCSRIFERQYSAMHARPFVI